MAEQWCDTQLCDQVSDWEALTWEQKMRICQACPFSGKNGCIDQFHDNYGWDHWDKSRKGGA